LLSYFSPLIADYPLYPRRELQKRIDANDYYLNQDGYEQGVPPGRLNDAEWFMDENDYERSKDTDQDLRPFYPVEDARRDRSVLDGGPLPPVGTENWNRINAKHGINEDVRSRIGQHKQGHHQDGYDALFNEYENLKARKHIRRGEDSGSSAVHGDRTDSSKHFDHSVDSGEYDKSNQLRDSLNYDVDSSSKKSDILSAEDSNGGVSVDGEKSIPPVPLSQEIAPDTNDNSGFQDNHMQTEKQASTKEAADAKAGERKVMVKGKVKQVKADIDQGPNPENTYQRVEDFFQSQRESSIVEVPNAVKKEEASKLYKDNFIPVKDASDEVDKEQGENSKSDQYEVSLFNTSGVSSCQVIGTEFWVQSVRVSVHPG